MIWLSPRWEHRARVQAFDRRWRVRIGPRRDLVTAALFQAGQPVALPAQTVLTAALRRGDAQISVTSTAGYPDEGMVAISPTGLAAVVGGEISWWSYNAKTPTAFHGVLHLSGPSSQAAGAAVVQWYDITPLLTADPEIAEFEDAYFIDWTATLQGVGFDSEFMFPEATVLIEENLSPNGNPGTWTGWKVAAVGYAREWEPTGDAHRTRPWRAVLSSVSAYVLSHKIAARQYGPVNVAEGASVSASPALGNPTLEPAEFAYGLGSTEASNVTDGNPDSLYISALAPSSAIRSGGAGTVFPFLIIEAVFPGGTGSLPLDLQWFQVRYTGNDPNGVNLEDYQFTGRMTLYEDPDQDEQPSKPYGFFIKGPPVVLTPEQRVAVLTRNRATYQAWYGSSNEAQVIDWRFNNSEAAEFELHRDFDVLHIRQKKYVGNQGIYAHIHDMVVWGLPTSFPPKKVFQDGDDTSQWAGAYLASPGGNTALQRILPNQDTNSAADWQAISDIIPGADRTHLEPIYVAINLGEFSVTIDEAVHPGGITAAVPGPGEWLSLTDAGPLDPSGTIQIDLEKIAYSARDDGRILVSARGADGTVAASHGTAAQVYQVSPVLGAHRLYPISSLQLVRRRVAAASGTSQWVVPQDLEVWASRAANPGFPGDDSYDLDWLTRGPLIRWTNHNGVAPTVYFRSDPEIGGPLRPRWLMVVVKKMSDDGRVKLNEVRAFRTYYSRTLEPPANTDWGQNVKGVFYDLLREVLAESEVRFDSNAVHLSDTSATVDLAGGNLGAVLEDLCAKYMARIRFGRDGIVSVEGEPNHPNGPRPDVMAEFTPRHLRDPQRGRRPSPLKVGQVIVELTNPDTGDIFTAAYPPVASPTGKVVEKPLVSGAANESLATDLAQALYFGHPSIANAYDCEVAGVAEWLHVGHRILLFDATDASTEGLVNCRVTAVTQGGRTRGTRFQAVKWVMP